MKIKNKIPTCEYCHQRFNSEDEIVWITSKKFIKNKESWKSRYKTKTIRKYHKRCWDKIEKRITKIEDDE